MFLDVSSLRQGSSDTSWRRRIIANLLTISAQKNRTLSSRIFHTSSKSVRGRILSYLNTVSIQRGSREFDIPFDRQQLADYLNVDRTALSKELGRMQKEGLIRFRKNHFVIETESITHDCYDVTPCQVF
jgi:CRP-like cAMP-binding protein